MYRSLQDAITDAERQGVSLATLAASGWYLGHAAGATRWPGGRPCRAGVNCRPPGVSVIVTLPSERLPSLLATDCIGTVIWACAMAEKPSAASARARRVDRCIVSSCGCCC